MDFVENYREIVRTWFTTTQPSQGEAVTQIAYLGGSHQGKPYLIAISCGSGILFPGVKFDLDEVRSALLSSNVGREAKRRGFNLSILDSKQTPEFDRERRHTIATVSGSSSLTDDLKLGLYAEDSAAAIRYYKRKRLLLFSVIILFTTTIGLEGYLVLRDTFREVNRIAVLKVSVPAV